MNARLSALFLAAVLGVLVLGGVALSGLGWVALGPYLGCVAVALAAPVRRARQLRRVRQDRAQGRTCTCCTSTVFDPVEVR